MLCECGCGEDAGIRTGNSELKGTPKKFVNMSHALRKTHCIRGHLLSPENRNAANECKLCSKIVRDAWVLANPDKDKASKDRWTDANREQLTEKSRRYRKEQPRAVQNTQLKRRYGITVDERDAQLAKQDNKCAICRIEFDEAHRPETDHDHATKRVRGQLCHACNVMLGQAKDNTETLAQAIAYLKGSECNQNLSSELNQTAQTATA